MGFLSFLNRERSIAKPGYSRWLVPPAALAIHLCIGQVYAFSVFKIPLTQLLGKAKSLSEDWTQSQLAWIFSLAIVMLGLKKVAGSCNASGVAPGWSAARVGRVQYAPEFDEVVPGCAGK